jgi:hypothetical protein
MQFGFSSKKLTKDVKFAYEIPGIFSIQKMLKRKAVQIC